MIDPVLISGGSGFIGRFLVSRLLADGNRVVALTRNPLTQSFTHPSLIWVGWDDDNALQGQTCYRAFVHLSTAYGRISESVSDVMQANLVRPLEVIDKVGARLGGIIAADTWFAKAATTMTRMQDYIRTKQQFAYEAGARAHRLGIPCIHGVCEQVYGPGDNPNKGLYGLVRAILNGISPTLEVDGTQCRDFIHVEDAASAFGILIDRLACFPPGVSEVGIGTGRSTSVREYLTVVANCSGFSGPLVFGSQAHAPGDLPRSVADTTVLTRFGWTPRYALTEGVRHFVDQERLAGSVQA